MSDTLISFRRGMARHRSIKTNGPMDFNTIVFSSDGNNAAIYRHAVFTLWVNGRKFLQFPTRLMLAENRLPLHYAIRLRDDDAITVELAFPPKPRVFKRPTMLRVNFILLAPPMSAITQAIEAAADKFRNASL